LVAVLVVLAAGTVPATAQEKRPETMTMSVTITNLSKQIISPPVLVSHTWKVAIFVPGKEASSELTALAEDGVTSDLADMLAAHDEVFDVTVADGMLFPGMSKTYELQMRGKYNHISAVGMLVSTNDAFFGLDSFQIDPSRVVHQTTAPVWDAGTEANNEDCDFIPGPPCHNPFMRATEGAEGFVHVHSGIHGTGDLSPAEWDWQNPGVQITVIKN
jgi:hypothetical protein